MKETSDELIKLFAKIQETRKTFQLSKGLSIDDLKKICEASSQMISISEISKYSIAIKYSNKKVLDFFDASQAGIVKLGFKFLLQILHPENLPAIYTLIRFFNDPSNANKIFSNTFYVNSKDGWEWIYTSVKLITLNNEKKARYIISTSCSLNEILTQKKQNKLIRQNLNFYEENMEKYLSMTKREKEVLALIADELTSVEIAEKLSISPLTVDAHRRNLIEKLGVKTSVGLIKYALLFKMGQ